MNIKKLILVGDYDEYDGNGVTIPSNYFSLTSLKIMKFTKSLLNMNWPNNLKRLELEILNPTFNYNLLLPNTIQSFTINYFTSIIRLPINLKKLKILNQVKTLPNEFEFPRDLISLTINIKELSNKLPSTLKYLNLSTYQITQNLPSNIEKLVIDSWNLDHNIIPQKNLKHLEIGGLFDKPLVDIHGIPMIPKSIEYLKFDSLQIVGQKNRPGFNQIIGKKDLIHCNKLKTLIFNCDFDQPISPGTLPNSITHLEFSDFNNGGYQLIEKNIFPSSIRMLDLGIRFNQPIGMGILSKNIKILKLGEYYNQKFLPKVLPPDLDEIEILNPNFRHPIPIKFNRTSIKCNINLKKIKSFKEDLKSIKLNTKCKRNINFDQLQQEQILQLQQNQENDQEDDQESDQENEQLNDNEINFPSFKNKKLLEYLQFDNLFNSNISIENLPKNNIIKTLVLGESFNKEINLKDFNQLEEIIIYGSPIINPTVISNINSNNEIENQYNFYNLKSIKTPFNNIKFLDNEKNLIFFKFINLIK